MIFGRSDREWLTEVVRPITSQQLRRSRELLAKVTGEEQDSLNEGLLIKCAVELGKIYSYVNSVFQQHIARVDQVDAQVTQRHG